MPHTAPRRVPRFSVLEAALVGFDVDLDMLGLVKEAEAVMASAAEISELVGSCAADVGEACNPKEAPAVIRKPLSS